MRMGQRRCESIALRGSSDGAVLPPQEDISRWEAGVKRCTKSDTSLCFGNEGFVGEPLLVTATGKG